MNKASRPEINSSIVKQVLLLDGIIFTALFPNEKQLEKRKQLIRGMSEIELDEYSRVGRRKTDVDAERKRRLVMKQDQQRIQAMPWQRRDREERQKKENELRRFAKERLSKEEQERTESQKRRAAEEEAKAKKISQVLIQNSKDHERRSLDENLVARFGPDTIATIPGMPRLKGDLIHFQKAHSRIRAQIADTASAGGAAVAGGEPTLQLAPLGDKHYNYQRILAFKKDAQCFLYAAKESPKEYDAYELDCGNLFTAGSSLWWVLDEKQFEVNLHTLETNAFLQSKLKSIGKRQAESISSDLRLPTVHNPSYPIRSQSSTVSGIDPEIIRFFEEKSGMTLADATEQLKQKLRDSHPLYSVQQTLARKVINPETKKSAIDQIKAWLSEEEEKNPDIRFSPETKRIVEQVLQTHVAQDEDTTKVHFQEDYDL